MVVWPVLDGLFTGFATHHWTKALPWLSIGPDDGDALWHRVLFEGVVEMVHSFLHAGLSGGNPYPTQDRARATLLHRVLFGTSPRMF